MAKTSKSSPAKTSKRKAITHDVKMLVLHEAGYRCAVPRCRMVLTIEMHHILYVSDGGPDTPENLIALCPTCHSLHHMGVISHASIRAWKFQMMALNEAFDRSSIDTLLTLFKLDYLGLLTGEGVIRLSPLVAADLVGIREYWQEYNPGTGLQALVKQYEARLTSKGKSFVEGWIAGDQWAALRANTVDSLPDLIDVGGNTA
jgi:hypothetical protein